MTRQWNAIRALVATLPFTLAAAPSTALAETFDGRIVEVVDGTTVTIDRTTGGRVTVRLAEIDTGLRGTRARDWVDGLVSSLLEGKAVTVLTEKSPDDGVVLGRVFVDDIDVSAEMVRNGWARVGGRVTDPALYQMQSLAKQEERGLWRQSRIAGAPVHMWRQARVD